jgi:hypothetical protein
MPKIIPYTAIIGGKDAERNDIQVFGDSDYDKFKLPVMNAKIFKIMPHKFLDCDISIWMDGNLFLNFPAEQIVEELLGDNDMALFDHWHRQSVYWELKWIEYQFRHNKESPILRDAQAQVANYKKMGVPRKTGIFSCGFMIRRHNKIVNDFNEKWWTEITRWSSRDQLSFPVAKLLFPELKINKIAGDVRNNPYLKYLSHKIPS